MHCLFPYNFSILWARHVIFLEVLVCSLYLSIKIVGYEFCLFLLQVLYLLLVLFFYSLTIYNSLDSQLQGRKFDHVDRLFSDMAGTSNRVLEDMSDVKRISKFFKYDHSFWVHATLLLIFFKNSSTLIIYKDLSKQWWRYPIKRYYLFLASFGAFFTFLRY